MKNIEKKLLLLAFIMCIITGCKTQEQACAAYADEKECCHETP